MMLWDAFFALNEHRGIVAGFGIVLEPKLTYAEVSAFAHDNGWMDDPRDAEAFFQIIRAMDDMWVTFHNKQKQAQAQNPTPKPPELPPRG